MAKTTNLKISTALLALVITLMFSPVSSDAQDRIYGAFDKTVVDALTGKPIAGATVEFIERSSRTSIVKRTNAQGDIYQELLPMGIYTVRVSAPGYSLVEFEQRLFITYPSLTVLDTIELLPEDPASGPETMIPLVAETGAQGAKETFPAISLQTGHAWRVSAIAFSPDSKILASGSYDSLIKLWDVIAGTELRTLDGHRSFIEAVASVRTAEL